jgi:hypothetical protein
MEHLDFLNNGIPKDIELINQLFDKIKWLENNQQNLFLNFEKAHSLINQLYINGVIVNATQLRTIIENDQSGNDHLVIGVHMKLYMKK